MSLKENIEMVKDELSSEEKFFEKAVVTERFVKKYKKPLIGSVVVIIAVVAINIVLDISNKNRIEAANETLAKLQKNPADAAALSSLESLSPQLHDVWLYSQALANQDAKTMQKLQNSKALLIPDLSSYETAQNTQDVKKLDAYAEKQGAIYKDLARVEAALVLMNEKKIKQAHAKLSMIAQNSPLAKVAQALMHYGVK